MVDHLEHVILQDHFAIGIFLDIEGAYDNLLPGSILKSLERRETPQSLLRWFRQYLLSPRVTLDHKRVTTNRRLIKGTP
jgi:hypothetical protein